MSLVLLALVLIAFSGVPGLFCDPKSRTGERISAGLHAAGSVLGIAGSLWGLDPAHHAVLAWRWAVPEGEFAVGIDGLSAFFLAPVFLISGLGSVYALDYWRHEDHPETGRRLRLFYGLLTVGMALLMIARHTLTFLLGWELMALFAFLTINTEDKDPAVREASLLYLFCTHAGTLALFVMFGLMRAEIGSFRFLPMGDATVASGAGSAIFLLALFGFGMKAGAMPFHIWLPSAHASAPTHVSALMSGVLIKTGIYGLARVVSLLPTPPAWWGGCVLAMGVVSGVLGVAFAIGQHDLKRLLAYHSIENIGIILIGFGAGMLGRALGRPDVAVLGFAGALLHVWNHGLFKALLFFSAGSVIHATGTREIDRLGGLGKAMPRTALAFLIGAVAICGLPPLNGFVSEMLVYLGLLRAVTSDDPRLWLGAALAAPALALVGALAVACFVKAYGAVFLGAGRSEKVAHAHDPGPCMLVPLSILAGLCALIGCAPFLFAPILEAGIAGPLGTVSSPLGELAPLGWVTLAALLLASAIAGGARWLAATSRREPAGETVTWDCGYAAPAPSMQYTSSSFADTLVGWFGWALRPESHLPKLADAPFPARAAFSSHVGDTVLDRIIVPFCRACAHAMGWFRWLQAGSLHAYLLYILVTLLLLLLWR